MQPTSSLYGMAIGLKHPTWWSSHMPSIAGYFFPPTHARHDQLKCTYVTVNASMQIFVDEYTCEWVQILACCSSIQNCIYVNNQKCTDVPCTEQKFTNVSFTGTWYICKDLMHDMQLQKSCRIHKGPTSHGHNNQKENNNTGHHKRDVKHLKSKRIDTLHPDVSVKSFKRPKGSQVSIFSGMNIIKLGKRNLLA